MSTEYNMINSAYSSCMSGETLSKSHIEKLLDINPRSSEAIYLRESAYRAALALTGGKAFLWSTGGLECMDCKYCKKSKQGALKHRMCQSFDKILENIRAQVQKGVNLISLNADNFFGIEDICCKTKRIKKEIKGRYHLQLVIDTGKISISQVDELCASEIDAICFVAGHEETDSNLTDCDSHFVYIADCIDSSYSNGKLAELISGSIEKKPKAIMVAPEKNESCRVSAERAAQIMAVLRLASGDMVKNIGASFLFNKMAISGANIIAAEIENSIDRMPTYMDKEMNINSAKTALRNAGYNILI